MCDFLDIFFILSLLTRVIKIRVSFLLYKIKQIQCKKKIKKNKANLTELSIFVHLSKLSFVLKCVNLSLMLLRFMKCQNYKNEYQMCLLFVIEQPN
jgi:hypothetical protein